MESLRTMTPLRPNEIHSVFENLLQGYFGNPVPDEFVEIVNGTVRSPEFGVKDISQFASDYDAFRKEIWDQWRQRRIDSNACTVDQLEAAKSFSAYMLKKHITKFTEGHNSMSSMSCCLQVLCLAEEILENHVSAQHYAYLWLLFGKN